MPGPQLSPRAAVVVGLLFAAAGVTLVLGAIGVVPVPVSPNTPAWLLACGGLTLVFIGGAVIVGFAVAVRPGPDGSPPVFAPLGLQLAQYLIGLGIVSTMTAAFTFVAFAPGKRHFSSSSSFLFWSQQGSGGEMAGRVAFGSGAVLMWIYLIAVGVSGARHLVREFRKR